MQMLRSSKSSADMAMEFETKNPKEFSSQYLTGEV